MEEKPYTEIHFEGTPEEVNAQWVENRKHGIGGSDVATIMGLNRFSSPYEVWLVKTGQTESPDLSGKEAVEWGNRLEDVVASKFAELHPELKVEAKEATLVSKERPWAFANLDRLLTDEHGSNGILEVKTAGAFRAHDWDDGVPTYYLTQVAHYMSVTGFDWAWFAVLIGGQEYREFRVERDEDDIKVVNEAVDGFWHGNVEKFLPPALVGSQSEAAALFEANREGVSQEIRYELDSELPDLDELDAIKEQIAQLNERKTQIENQVKLVIGADKGVETETKRITWVRSTRKTLDAKRLKEEHPDIAEEYTVPKVVNGGLRIKRKE